MKAIASNPKTDIDIRLEAAEFAEAAGAMDAGDLIQLMALTFDDAVRADPIEGALDLVGPENAGLALPYRDPDERIRRSRPKHRQGPAAFRRRRSIWHGRPGVRSRYRPYSTGKGLGLVRARRDPVLLFSGRNKLADAWLVTLRAAAMFDQNLALGGGMVMPMAAYVNHPLAADWFEKEFSTWWPLVAAKPKIARTVPQMLGLLEANGHPAPNDAWTPILIGAERATVAMPGPAPWFRLREDAEAGRGRDRADRFGGDWSGWTAVRGRGGARPGDERLSEGRLGNGGFRYRSRGDGRDGVLTPCPVVESPLRRRLSDAMPRAFWKCLPSNGARPPTPWKTTVAT